MNNSKNTLNLFFNNVKIRNFTFIWILQWLVVAGGTFYILPFFNADQLNHVEITATYFLVSAALGVWFYRIDSVFAHHASFKKQGLIILFLFAAIFSICTTINMFFPINEGTQQQIQATKFYFPLFKYSTLLAKICDISFQQVFILGILKKLKEENLNNSQAVKVFSVAFFILHLPLMYTMKFVSLYFIVPSLIAGVIFSYLILNYRFGWVKSFAVHLGFYLFIGLYFRYFNILAI